MTPDELKRVAQDISKNGPMRVVVDAGGYAVPPGRANVEYKVQPDVIFIREDGWSLGAPARFEAVARSMWQREWVGIMRAPWLPAPSERYGFTEVEAIWPPISLA